MKEAARQAIDYLRREGAKLTLYLGFATMLDSVIHLTTEQVRGEIHPNGDPVEDHANAGYFFIFQQPPGRTRFGLDVNSAPNLTDWNDLGWDHRAITDSNWLRSDYALGVPDNRLPAWGENAADMAEILRQKPFRIAIHADDMILYQG